MTRRMRIFIVYVLYVWYSSIVINLILLMQNQHSKKNEEESSQDYSMSVQQPKTGAVANSSIPVESMSWIIQPDATNKKGLALSNYAFVKNSNNLAENNFGAVISVFGETELQLQGHINHFRILVGDSPNQNIICFFESSYKFIIDNLKKTNVVVHCKAGVSRSATIIAAYLMRHDKMTCNQAIKLLQKKRSIVDPNKGFRRQLRQYDSQLQKQRQECLIY